MENFEQMKLSRYLAEITKRNETNKQPWRTGTVKALLSLLVDAKRAGGDEGLRETLKLLKSVESAEPEAFISATGFFSE